ncbi:MAG: hypothetical protein NTV43_09365 [Methylococcales bacterium]|nr:hypothetical protein [Methylococcales bacterium]
MIEIAVLKPFAAKVASSLFASFLAKKLTDKAQQKQIELCVEGLCEEWLISVLKSLRDIDYPEEALKDLFQHYCHDLEKFVKDEAVAEELLKPLTETTSNYQLDSALLRNCWQELNLQDLPEEFEIDEICRLYLRRVRTQGIVTTELRALYLAQLAQDSTNYLHAIRGYWPDFDLDRYKERLTTRYKTLDLSALTPPVRDDIEVSVLLQDVFIPQTVKESRPPRELPKELQYGEVKDLADLQADDSKRIDWVQQTVKPVLEIFDKHKLVILGDPGSGKSSLARFLLLSCLSPKIETGATPAWLEPLKGHLPLLIELRSYIAAVSQHHCDNFLDYLHYLGKSEGYGLNHLDLKTQLKNSPALVLFDGLDEIFDPAQREKISQEIIGFANDYAKARVLITSRLVGYQGTTLRHADFSEYTLQDLDKEQIQLFAQGWFKLVFHNRPEEVTSRIQRIQQAVEHSPAIAQLAGNPLLLTIIAIIAKHQELPRERVLLYDHAVKVLCHHWDVTEHKINHTPIDFMRENDKLELLRRIASRMQQSPNGLSGNVIHPDDLQQEIESYLSQRWQLSPTESARIGSAMIDQLRARNFILCFYGAESYGFVHRTFLEYFCADEIKQRFDKRGVAGGISFDELKKLFVAYYRDDAWHEILRLICGMVDAKFAGQLIDAILPAREKAYEESAVLTLAIQCLAEVTDLNEIPETAKQVLDCLCAWFDEMEIRNSMYEEEFGKNALPAIERIGKNWVGREKFLNWIASIDKVSFSFEGTYCFGRMVAALWSDCDDIQQYLIELTCRQSASLKLMGFEALARCFKESTRDLLEEQLMFGETDTKILCIWTLTKHYQNRVEIYLLIKQYLQHDNVGVRRAAVEALVKKNYSDSVKSKLLLQDFDNNYSWLDALKPITQARVKEAAEKLNLSSKAIRQHYQEITLEIPLILEWQNLDSTPAPI